MPFSCQNKSHVVNFLRQKTAKIYFLVTRSDAARLCNSQFKQIFILSVSVKNEIRDRSYMNEFEDWI